MASLAAPNHDPNSRSLYAGLEAIVIGNAVKELRQMARNTAFGFPERLGTGGDGQADPRRDYDEECGYPKTVTAEDYYDQFLRGAYPARVVECMPRESWQVNPDVYETEDDDDTEFELAWKDLGARLRGGLGLYNGTGGDPIWDVCLRADILSGIGSYGVILIGLNDGKKLHEPVDFGDNLEREVLFLRVFPEALARITQVEEDITSPRFGQPNQYLITFNDPKTTSTTAGGIMGTSIGTANVHWTRVVHIADNLESSEIFGAPRMRQVYPELLDIRKVKGGSAEMYWRGALPGLSFETHPQLGGDVEIDLQSMQDQIENYMQGLSRELITSGMAVKSLTPSVADPTPFIIAHVEAICVKLGIPKRVFMGSERGELASSQDDGAWNDRLKARQQTHITPRIIVPLVDRLIAVGALPVPVEYYIDWPDLTSQTETEKADVALKKLTAVQAYIASGAEQLIPPAYMLTAFLGFTEEEAESMLLEGEKIQLEAEQEDIQKQQDMIAQGLAPDPTDPSQNPAHPASPFNPMNAPPGGVPLNKGGVSPIPPNAGGANLGTPKPSPKPSPKPPFGGA